MDDLLGQHGGEEQGGDGVETVWRTIFAGGGRVHKAPQQLRPQELQGDGATQQKEQERHAAAMGAQVVTQHG